MAIIDEERSLLLEQALKDISNYGSKLYKPEDLPFYDQPVNYEEEKKRFEPIQMEELDEEINHEEASLSPCQVAELQPMVGAASAEGTHQRMSKSKNRESLAKFQGKYLQPVRISHRKAVYVSEETQRRLDFVVRKIGEQGASISGYVEQVLREHLDRYKEEVEVWRKL